ncbi:MAG: transposase [Candidatus Marithrix sp.]|nr:transposase [Candidatus Marithrix sp.]
MTKAGNRHLHRALFMPALSAIRHNVNVKTFYNYLLDKSKMQVCCHAKITARYLWNFKNWTTMILSFMLFLN